MGFTLQPATKDDFIDREDILKEMLNTLTDRNIKMGFALVGPRRIGKTSILKEVVRRIKERDNILAVYFSVWDLVDNTAIEFCNRLTLTIIESFKKRLSVKYKIQHLLKVPASKLIDFLKTIDLKISVLEDVEFTLTQSRRGDQEINVIVEKVFGFAERLAEDMDVRLVLMLDEFPSIMDLKNGAKLGEGILKKIRTIHEGLEHTILCISGSVRKTMDMAVLSQSSAFYRQFIIKNIIPFDAPEVKNLMVSNLKPKLTKDAVNKIYHLTKGIPFYVQFIGRELRGLEGKTIDSKSVQEVFNEFLDEEGDIIFFEELKAFSDKEKGILTAMAINDIKTPKEICKITKEKSNIISRYMEYFLDKGCLERKEKGAYEFTDPVFKEWLKRRYNTPTYL
jgi:AAA+ ATPase superfamily predicted ATPase